MMDICNGNDHMDENLPAVNINALKKGKTKW